MYELLIVLSTIFTSVRVSLYGHKFLYYDISFLSSEGNVNNCACYFVRPFISLFTILGAL